VKEEQLDIPAITKSHASLSPRTNLMLIFVWAAAIISAFLNVQPRLPFAIALTGGVLGAVAGLMQHLSIGQSPERFNAASSLMGVRRARKRVRFNAPFPLRSLIKRCQMWLS